jgi:superfamily II RNA helicase
MAKAFQEKVWASMTQNDFVAFLASFLQEGKADEEPSPNTLTLSEATRNALNYVDELAFTYQKDEQRKQMGTPSFWELRTKWIEPLQKWMDGEDPAVICSDYGLYEGNFIRSVLKVSNMVDEWISLATFTKTIELLKMLEGLRETLVRDIAKPESLYLTL